MPTLRTSGLFILTLGIALLVLEAVLRFFFVAPRYKVSDSELGLLNRPNARVVWSDEGWAVNRVNSLGLMGPELKEPRPRLRVLLLGNSYTEALQVSRDESFAGVGESLIPGSEFINAAHSNWSMAEELGLLRRLSPLLEPDVVVAQFSAKPPFGEADAHLREDEIEDWRWVPAPENRSALRRLKDLTDPFAQHSALLTMLLRKGSDLARREQARLRGRFVAEQPTPVGRREANARSLAREADATAWLLDQMAAESRGLLVVLVIPGIDYQKGVCAERHEVRTRREMIHQVAARQGVALVDPSQAFCEYYLATGQPLHGFQNVKMGSGHLNPHGHQVLARQLALAILGTDK